MIGNYFARLTGSKRNLLALLASSAVFTAGCANMSTTAPSGNPFSAPATLSGTIHGGNQPVVGSAVTLWFAGQGAPAIKAATTTTDATGSFSFTRNTGSGLPNDYACPTSGGSPLVYVTSVGGNTQGVLNGPSNSAAAFIALYGDCTNINASNFVFMSEATTVATMATVQQFFNPVTETLVADSTGQQRLIILNLPNTANLLANAATGMANTATTVPATTGGSIAPGVSLTATPETAKINTIANIISSCVNATSSTDAKCTALFSASAPPAGNVTNLNPSTNPSFPPATDTLQALFYIFTNPTNGNVANMVNLFALQPATGAAYTPFLTARPTDWTIGVSYASTSTCGTSSGNFISSPTDINIDALDNVWFGNAQTGGNLSSISAGGAPLYCLNFDSGAVTSGGTFDSFASSTNNFNPNVWSANGTNLWRYNPISQVSTEFPVGVTPLAITADGVGNVYFTSKSGTTGSLWVLVNAANVAPPLTPLLISTTVGPNPLHLMPDFKGNATLGNIWVSSGSTFVSQVTPSLGGMNGFATNPFTISGSNAFGVSVSRTGIFISSLDTGAISQLIPSGSTFISANGFPFTAATAGINAPKGIAVDGRTNTWIANSGASSLSQISLFAGPLSPTTGFQKVTTFLNANTNIAVDQAGNVWVAGTGNAFITEIVGAGVPIYAPYAVGLANGRFQTIP